jgi:hypothetical protein
MQADGVAPSNLAVTSEGGISLLLSWTNVAPDARQVSIERKVEVSGTYAEIATVSDPFGGPPPNTFTDGNVQPGITYYYRVRGTNGIGGFTPYSNEASGTP